MRTIHQLSESLIRQIAAGEVISEPSSIVKEAIENSIDAKSNQIEVEIKNGGISLIKISDDGHGLSKDDLKVATDRHSTSKIKNEKDLERIYTLGFRGEFLSSLVSVADLEIISSLKGSTTSYRAIYSISGSNPILEQYSRTQGTTLIVKGLFNNVPARRKFLPSNRKNIGRIHEVVRQFSLGYPEIKFILKSENKELFRNQPGSLLNAMSMIFGRNVSKNFLKIDSKTENDLWSLRGYISIPSETRPNRSYQYIFINNRIIQNPIIEKALHEGYGNYLSTKQFPILILNFKTLPTEYDANVHPAKKEVRLKDAGFVFNFIKNSIQKCLLSANSESNTKMNFVDIHQNEINEYFYSSNYNKDEYINKNQVQDPFDVNKSFDDFFIEEKTNKINNEDRSNLENTNLPYNKQKLRNIETDMIQHVIIREEIKNLVVIFQLNKKFILAFTPNNPGDLYIIDQHAVSERLALENLIKKSSSYKIKQQLLEPIVIKINPLEFNTISSSLQFFNSMGYSLEKQNNLTLIINSYPKFFGKKLSKHLIIYNLRQIIDDLQHVDSNSSIKSVTEMEIAKSIACRNSIKAGDSLTQNEMKIIIKNMNKAKYPWVCCHGRPSIFKIKEKFLNKLFWRE